MQRTKKNLACIKKQPNSILFLVQAWKPQSPILPTVTFYLVLITPVCLFAFSFLSFISIYLFIAIRLFSCLATKSYI